MLLLDTHVFLWALSSSARLSTDVRALLEDPRVPVFVSAVSVWECAVKRQLGRLRIAEGIDLVEAVTASGFAELAVSGAHAARTEAVSDIHRDPFDRLLIAQSLEEGLTLVTADDHLHAYPEVQVLRP